MTIRGPQDSQPAEPGWWLASDGKWYPPESRPGTSPPPPPPTVWAPTEQSWSAGPATATQEAWGPGATASTWATPPPTKRRRVWPWVVGVLVVFAVAVGSCVAVIGVAANHVVNEHAITPSQFDAAQLGKSRSQVEHDLGSPASTQNFSSTLGGTRSCIYYRQKGHIVSRYQFCFQDDRLDSKNAY